MAPLPPRGVMPAAPGTAFIGPCARGAPPPSIMRLIRLSAPALPTSPLPTYSPLSPSPACPSASTPLCRRHNMPRDVVSRAQPTQPPASCRRTYASGPWLLMRSLSLAAMAFMSTGEMRVEILSHQASKSACLIFPSGGTSTSFHSIARLSESLAGMLSDSHCRADPISPKSRAPERSLSHISNICLTLTRFETIS